MKCDTCKYKGEMSQAEYYCSEGAGSYGEIFDYCHKHCEDLEVLELLGYNLINCEKFQKK